MANSLNLCFLLFAIHGVCYFRILGKLRKAGVPVKTVVDVPDAISYYRMYFREAATRGWSRLVVYLSVLSLLASLTCAAYWILSKPRKSKAAATTGTLDLLDISSRKLDSRSDA